jgi:hypothetical protein
MRYYFVNNDLHLYAKAKSSSPPLLTSMMSWDVDFHAAQRIIVYAWRVDDDSNRAYEAS